MKKIFHHPTENLTGKKYWRSLGQLSDTPEFRGWLEREFPAGAAELKLDGVSRRNFLKLMGASATLAGFGLVGCRRDEKNLVPFTKSVEWSIPGKPLFYSTSMPHRKGAQPLVVTTHDGRPTKVDGNPLHPWSKGGSDTFAQASLLDLYDPDRSRFYLKDGKKSDAKAFDAYLDKLVAESGTGEGMAFLVEENNSPTRERLRLEIERKFPQAKWCVYEPLANDVSNEVTRTAFGEGVRAAARYDKADVILALDCDFLGCEEGSVEAVRNFAARRRVRKPGDTMNRLYVVENRYTTTGGMAEHRLAIPASQIGAFVIVLAREVGIALGDDTFKDIASYKGAMSFDPVWVRELAADLVSAGQKSLVVVGSRQPVAVQLLVQAINAQLGNIGHTIEGFQVSEKPGITISDLAKAITDKQVNALFILGGNPVYNAPSDLEWEKLQKSVPNVIRLGLHVDETSQAAQWHVPAAHYLETWSDGRAADGSYVSVQPMILPLYDGLSELDILVRVLGQKKPEGPELVKETFQQLVGGDAFDVAWNKFLHDGFAEGACQSAVPLSFNGAAVGVAVGASLTGNGGFPSAPTDDGLEIVFIADASMEDGRYNNNGWLQEVPDPVTKLTWDNAALMSPKTAKRFGLIERKLGQVEVDVVEISIENRKIEIPVLVAPGHADNSISLPLGYGRKVTGRVGRKAGVNVYPLRTTTQPYFAVGAKVSKTGRVYQLAQTQEHHSLEGRGDDLLREQTLEHYNEDPKAIKTMGMDSHIPPNISLYNNPPLTNPHQWGMVIDLNTCIGCNACVIACQAENNIPIVGKEQVINGREMHWIRNDRYFVSEEGSEDAPDMVMQPMMCQHCENAPCETVCPVNATVHSDDGLNVMTYNRCIGTRYCANNCPFKVRRFNFFDYNQRPIEGQKFGPFEDVSGLKLGPLTEKGSPASLKMQKNPNVTVRMRGVMEKCTFCVQRIQEAKIAQKVKAGASPDVKIPANAFQVACQQACAADSIVFGDITNPESEVSKLREAGQNYRLLEYLNVNARVSYLGRLRNWNMKMPGAKEAAERMKAHGHHGHGAAHDAGHGAKDNHHSEHGGSH